MNSTWKYYDIMDLEYFFQQDGNSDGVKLHERDRQIYLDHERSTPQETNLSPQFLLAIWLSALRRKYGDDGPPLPGRVCREAHILLRLILMIFGLFGGGGIGLAFLAYSGTTPVNVLHFLVLFVFSQVGLAAILLARAALVRFGLGSVPRSLLVRTLGTILLSLLTRLLRRASRHFSGEQRLSIEATLGRLQAGTVTMPLLFYWPLFQLLQLTGVCFNLGLLATTFFRISVSDLAFGWQSTLQFSAQSLHSFVSWMALPWGWLFPEGTGYPSLTEIEGSRIILKEGITHLQTPDLISWWPFLLLSIVVYGLVLRLLLMGFGWLQQRRASRHPVFTSPAARQVVRRMQTPLVSSHAAPETAVRNTAETEAEPTTTISPIENSLLPVIVLLPDDIFDSCSPGEMTQILAASGYRIYDIHRFMVDYESDRQLPARLTEDLPDDLAGIIILMEAWMPPLVSFQSFLRHMRQHFTTLPIMLRLVGKPVGTSALTPVGDANKTRIWQEKMTALGDRQLTTRELIDKRT